MAFGVEAKRSSAKLRIAILGLPGVGKTFSALLMAAELGGVIGLLDSEHESALKSVGRTGIPRFRHQPMTEHSLQEFIAQTGAAAEAGVSVLIYDSWSHSWISALEAVDAMGGNKFSNGWKTISPLQKKLTDRMIAYPGHIIATMRLDSEYAVEKDDKSGKAVPRKIGLAATARKGTEYEFDFVLRLVDGGKVIVDKSRNGELLPVEGMHDRADLPKIARRLVEWLNEGEMETTADVVAKLTRRANVADTEGLKSLGGEIRMLGADVQAAMRPVFKARIAALASEGGQ